MKKTIFTPLLLLFSAAAFVACSDDEKKDGPDPVYEVISFEPSKLLTADGKAVSLGDVTMNIWNLGGDYTYHNAFCGKPYATTADFDDVLFTTANGSASFLSYYASQFDAWGGIALAASPDMNPSEQPITQQFSVWAGGGAEGTSTYAVCYDSNTPTEVSPEYMTASGYPTIRFSKACKVLNLWIANSTYVYNWFQGAADDLFQVKITGKKGGSETGSTTVTLIEGNGKLSGWKNVDLQSLGEVDELVFKVQGIDVTSDPSYFCIDEIRLQLL